MLRARLGAAAIAVLLLIDLPLPVSPPAPAPAPTRPDRMAVVRSARTINYYPARAGWTAMWTDFDAARIGADLAVARTLGADNVRVIVFPQSFGYPAPDGTYTGRLAEFVDLAAGHGLSVKLTLFDWWAAYTDVAASIAWAKAVLAPYTEDPRVVAVELKNEFQPDDADAVAWVRELIPALRAAARTGAAGLAKIRQALAGAPLDFYDFHFYGNSERALTEIRKAQAAVAPFPLVIGETGLSSATGGDGEQAAYLARTFRAAKEAGVASVAPWTLFDFTDGAIPAQSAVSVSPPQYRFGLYRADGTAKPAADVVRAAWTAGTTSNSVLDPGFEAPAGRSPWRPYLAEGGTVVVATGTARTGAHAARFTGGGRPSLRVGPITPVQPGYRWRAEAWARGAGATGVTEIALSWFGADGTWIGQNTSDRLPDGDTGWTKLVVQTVAPPGAAGVQLHLKSAGNSGTVWFDDVAVS